MDWGALPETGAVEKTASQLRKEFRRLEKMEKFSKKKEKEAALAENGNQVCVGLCTWLTIYKQRKLKF